MKILKLNVSLVALLLNLNLVMAQEKCTYDYDKYVNYIDVNAKGEATGSKEDDTKQAAEENAFKACEEALQRPGGAGAQIVLPCKVIEFKTRCDREPSFSRFQVIKWKCTAYANALLKKINFYSRFSEMRKCVVKDSQAIRNNQKSESESFHINFQYDNNQIEDEQGLIDNPLSGQLSND
jgi:hypothetical protein